MISRAVLFEQIVGREAELDRLVSLRDQSALDGQVRLVSIRGDAGIGKSRLIAELARRSANFRNLFLRVRCRPEGAASYAPIVDALEEIARANPRSELAPDALRSLRSPDSDDVSPQELVRRRLVCIADAFAAEAKRRGHLTLTLDDAHWSDTETIAALRFLTRRVAPLLIVVAYRPGDLTDPFRISALTDLEREGGDRIVLGPLHEREQLQLLERALPATPRAVLQRIVELAEGQPFIAEELARSAAGGASASEVPLTLRAAILGRVADLSREARGVLQRAAILGPSFRFEDLAALGASDTAAIVETLRDARDRQILIEEERGGLVRFRFRHAMTHAVFLGEMLAVERQQLHRMVADLIESDGASDRMEELAYHRWASRDGDPAIAACEAVGDSATRRAAFHDAARWFERALEFAMEDIAFARLSRKRLDALTDAGALDAVALHCNRMIARLAGTGLEDAAARAVCVAGMHLAMRHRVREAAELLDSGLVASIASRDAEVRFERSLGLVWVTLRRSPGDASAFEELDAALSDARALGPRAEARVLHARQAALLLHKDASQLPSVTDKAAALATACGDYRLQVNIATNRALYEQYHSLERAIPFAREAAAICEARGDYFAASNALANLSAYLFVAGNLAEGAKLLRQADTRGMLDNIWLGAELLSTYLTGGDMQRFVALLEPERFDGSPWIAFVVATYGARALPPLEAQALIRRALPFVVRKPGGVFAVSAALHGDDAAFGAVRNAMRDYVATSPNGLANFKLFSAISLRREHRPLAAREAAREAIAAFLACGHLANGLAQAYVEAGQPEKAIELLERIGATAPLARLRQRPDGVPQASAASLSQREAQIAHLAIRGMSSRETGLRLGISARTVETHLANVYRKLGVSSKPELAARLEQLVEAATLA